MLLDQWIKYRSHGWLLFNPGIGDQERGKVRTLAKDGDPVVPCRPRDTLHSKIPKRTDKGKPAILYIVITCQKESLTYNNNRSMRRTSNGILEIVRSCIHGGMHSCHAFCVIRGC